MVSIPALSISFGALGDKLQTVTSFQQLEEMIRIIQDHLGISYHYLSFADGSDEDPPIILTDVPADHDFTPGPCLMAASHRVRPYFWNLEKQQPQDQRAGSTVFVIPLHLHGIGSGFHAWFMKDREFSRVQLPGAVYLAGGIFDRLCRLQARPKRSGQKLTPRQIDCLRLAARGKSDWVTSRILGLQPDTVHKYIEHAKTRYDVSTRTELVVRALYNGELHFHDLID